MGFNGVKSTNNMLTIEVLKGDAQRQQSWYFIIYYMGVEDSLQVYGHINRENAA
jgi:hypothetical protein